MRKLTSLTKVGIFIHVYVLIHSKRLNELNTVMINAFHVAFLLYLKYSAVVKRFSDGLEIKRLVFRVQPITGFVYARLLCSLRSSHVST